MSVLSVAVVGGILLALAIEGLCCIALAAPIGITLAIMGGILGWAIQRRPWSGRDVPALMLVLIFGTPSFMGLESHVVRNPEQIESVNSSVSIKASADQVWNQIKSVDAIHVSKPFLLHIGLPVPVKCKLEQERTGGRRICYFRNGIIEERVTEYKPPQLMKLIIARSTLPEKHWLKFKSAVYRLKQEGDQTIVIRTTTYSSTLRPRWYWKGLETMGVESEHRYLLDELAWRFNQSTGSVHGGHHGTEKF